MGLVVVLENGMGGTNTLMSKVATVPSNGWRPSDPVSPVALPTTHIAVNIRHTQCRNFNHIAAKTLKDPSLLCGVARLCIQASALLKHSRALETEVLNKEV